MQPQMIDYLVCFCECEATVKVGIESPFIDLLKQIEISNYFLT